MAKRKQCNPKEEPSSPKQVKVDQESQACESLHTQPATDIIQEEPTTFYDDTPALKELQVSSEQPTESSSTGDSKPAGKSSEELAKLCPTTHQEEAAMEGNHITCSVMLTEIIQKEDIELVRLPGSNPFNKDVYQIKGSLKKIFAAFTDGPQYSILNPTRFVKMLQEREETELLVDKLKAFFSRKDGESFIYFGRDLPSLLNLQHCKKKPDGIICDILCLSSFEPPMVISVYAKNATCSNVEEYNRSLAREVTLTILDFSDEDFAVLSGILDLEDFHIDSEAKFQEKVEKIQTEGESFHRKKRLQMQKQKYDNILTALLVSAASTEIPAILDTPKMEDNSTQEDGNIYMLTKEQFSVVFVSVDLADILIVNGVSNTGKTVLALELAQRLELSGNTLFVTDSNVLHGKAEHLDICSKTISMGDFLDNEQLCTTIKHVIIHEKKRLFVFKDVDTKINSYQELTETIGTLSTDNDTNKPEENWQADVQNSLLKSAREAGNNDLVEKLLNEDFNINMKYGWYERSPIHFACEQGNIQLIDKIMKFPDADVHVKDHFGRTPLRVACDYKNVQVMQRLVEYGADVNIGDERNRTPLRIACEGGDPDVVGALLQRNADVNMADNKKLLPLHIACQKGDADIVTKLIEMQNDVCNFKYKSGKSSLLHFACETESETLMEKLFDRFCDVNVRDTEGRSPLHIACAKGNINIVKKLFEHKADINVQAKDGTTPLHIAGLEGNTTVIKHLLEYGADMNIVDINNKSPLHVALEKKCKDAVDIFVRFQTERSIPVP